MKKETSPVENVDAYIRQFPAAIQKLLKQIRKAIREAAPEAEETIAYMMPAYKQNGPLVYFGGFKSHIGFYPAGSTTPFESELNPYRTGKGTLQFPLDQPLPLDLIKRIVQFRVGENEKKTALKKKKK